MTDTRKLRIRTSDTKPDKIIALQAQLDAARQEVGRVNAQLRRYEKELEQFATHCRRQDAQLNEMRQLLGTQKTITTTGTSTGDIKFNATSGTVEILQNLDIKVERLTQDGFVVTQPDGSTQNITMSIGCELVIQLPVFKS